MWQLPRHSFVSERVAWSNVRFPPPLAYRLCMRVDAAAAGGGGQHGALYPLFLSADGNEEAAPAAVSRPGRPAGVKLPLPGSSPRSL